MTYAKIAKSFEELVEIREESILKGWTINLYESPDKAVFGYKILEENPPDGRNMKESEQALQEAMKSRSRLVVWMPFGKELNVSKSEVADVAEFMRIMGSDSSLIPWPLADGGLGLYSYAMADSGRASLIWLSVKNRNAASRNDRVMLLDKFVKVRWLVRMGKEAAPELPPAPSI